MTLLNHSSLLLFIAKLLTEELKQPAIPASTKISPKQRKAYRPEAKIKKEDEDFSDGTDNATTDDMDLESVERLDSYSTDEDQQGTVRNSYLIIKDYLSCDWSQKERETIFFSQALCKFKCSNPRHKVMNPRRKTKLRDQY